MIVSPIESSSRQSIGGSFIAVVRGVMVFRVGRERGILCVIDRIVYSLACLASS